MSEIDALYAAVFLGVVDGKPNINKYRYIGNEEQFRNLEPNTAYGGFRDGFFVVQVDDLNHDFTYGWHAAKFDDWELVT